VGESQFHAGAPALVALAWTSIFLSSRSCSSWLTELNFGMHLARSMVRAFNKRQGFDMAGKLRPASLPTTINYEFPLHRLSHWHRYQRMLHTRQYGSSGPETYRGAPQLASGPWSSRAAG